MENLKLIANKTVEQLVKDGADKARCIVKSKETQEFNVDGGEFSLFRTLFDNKISIMLIKDNKKGNIAINRFDDESITKAVKNCINVANSGTPDKAWDIAPKQENKTFVDGCPTANIDLFFERTKRFVKDIKERHPRIIIEQMILAHEKENSIYLDTNGTEYDMTSGNYSVSLMISGHEGDKVTSFFETGFSIDNLDKPFIELGSVEKDLTDVENQLNTVPLTGKFEGVALLNPSCLESIIYSIINNFAGTNVILDGTSVWKDKINKKVADEQITISINPLDEKIVCGERVTEDGFISENYDFIKDGVLKSFFIPLYVANKTGYERAKNSSYSIVIKEGNTPVQDIIKGIKKGLIVGRFSGGNPSVSGDFSGVAKNSFLVEDGKIVGAVNEVMINGNLSDLLNNLVTISKETVQDGSKVLPYMAFDKVIISGK
jgi:PmbA protein